MPLRLTLICHAATEAIRLGRFPADEDIDADGSTASARVEAPKAGHWLSGPERRARRTAGLLSGEAVAVEPALRDWDLGTWRGRSLPDVAEADPAAATAWLSDATRSPHGGESLQALLARASGFLKDAAERGDRLAAVTHPAVVRAAVVAALGADASVFWRIDAPPLARARLSHDGRRWILQALVPPRR